MKKQKEIVEFKCSEMEATNVSLIQEAKQYRVLNETLNKSLQDTQVDLLLVGGEDFERAKAQALCIMPDLDGSKMNIFKTVMDEQLMDLE